jgi:hypothetical protein
MRVTWTSRLDDIAKNQLAQGIAWGLNDTAQEAVTLARQTAMKRLAIKKPGLLNVFMRTPVDGKATKRKLSARVLLAGPKSDPQRGSVLAQQEDTDQKRAFRGRLVAMPSRDIMQKIGGKRVLKPGYALKNFKPFSTPVDAGLNQTPNGARGTRIEGRKNTYVVFRKGSGLPILLQRYGKGKQQVRALYLWVKAVRLPKRLGFTSSVTTRVRQRNAENIGRGITKAIASAREVVKGGGVTSSRLP